MGEQVLGGYTFEYDPSTMDIPESKKTVATVKTYSGTAVFQWPPLIAGQMVTLKWNLMTDTMYEQLRTFYLSLDEYTWIPKPATLDYAGASYQVNVFDLAGVYNEATFHHQPYRFDVKMVLHILSEAEIAKLEPEP